MNKQERDSNTDTTDSGTVAPEKSGLSSLDHIRKLRSVYQSFARHPFLMKQKPKRLIDCDTQEVQEQAEDEVVLKNEDKNKKCEQKEEVEETPQEEKGKEAN
ncbi:Lon protease [Trichinella spiralis]|uniref:Lon protease n=1 Tax=Trichinella spiralis TaxID=6334 RepID=A0ABR3KRG0_TRISP